jgi:hypothetical protein
MQYTLTRICLAVMIAPRNFLLPQARSLLAVSCSGPIEWSRDGERPPEGGALRGQGGPSNWSNHRRAIDSHRNMLCVTGVREGVRASGIAHALRLRCASTGACHCNVPQGLDELCTGAKVHTPWRMHAVQRHSTCSCTPGRSSFVVLLVCVHRTVYMSVHRTERDCGRASKK